MKVCMNLYLFVEHIPRTLVKDNEHYTGASHAINHFSVDGTLWVYFMCSIRSV